MNARQLQVYAIEQALQHQSEIAPELMSFIGGDSKTAIDASIEMAKAKSAQIIARARQEMARPADVDPQWQANVREGTAAADELLAAQVNRMSLAEYARERGRLGVYKPTIDFLGGSR